MEIDVIILSYAKEDSIVNMNNQCIDSINDVVLNGLATNRILVEFYLLNDIQMRLIECLSQLEYVVSL